MYDDLQDFNQEELLNIKGRFSRENYETNQNTFESCTNHTKLMASGDRGIWDVPWMVENYSDEDSDDDDSEESEEEEVKVEKPPAKVDRKNSLKPFTDLESFTLKMSAM